ncbi:hypothetical protein [Blautia obeum]|uniref:hypothetical protein n=1 Tax=Blautia obeum TaxID=40520 RepID=UPI003D02731E
MDTNCGFEKYEGYVGNKEDFNGVIFYLREPNTEGNEAEEFWFKRIIIDKENYYKELEEAKCEKIETDKRIASKFENRFNEMLEQLGLTDKQLKDVVYCNVHSDFGEKSVTNEYREKLTNAVNKLKIIVENMNRKELIVFTCKDIFNKLCDAWNDGKRNEDGLKYNNEKKCMHYFCCEIGDKKITVYEILHPSRSSCLQKN